MLRVICALPAGTPNCSEMTGSAGRYISIDNGINMARRPRINTIFNDERGLDVTIYLGYWLALRRANAGNFFFR
ncbi:hypothetical protein KATP_14660 [Kluyvera ascorbata]|nr:hypothetical protein KATP_14660 [Kluyvera ascorbata]